MTGEVDKEEANKWKMFSDVLFYSGFIIMLGSCVYKIDALGGQINANQKAAGIFFTYLLFVFPALLGLKIFMDVKLEKKFKK